jgi:hypothetical protein
MTPERIVKLDKLGFAWDCRKNNTGTGGKDSGDDSSDTKEVVPPASPVAVSVATKPTTPLVNNVLLRLGGFPLPKPPSSGGGNTTNTVAAFKQPQQFKSVQMPAVQPAPVAAEPLASETATTLSSLPCEFFSFRKFTKFPKINLTK